MSTKEKVLELINKEIEENCVIINNESDYHYDDYQAVKIQTNFLTSMQSKIEQFPDNEADLRKENEEMKAMLEEIYNDVEAFSDLSSYGYGSKIEELLNKER